MVKYKKIDFDRVHKNIDKVGQIMEAHGGAIVVAYLFGSLATGEITPLSDIDIAILFCDNLSEFERQKIENEIFFDISKLLGTDEIDIIILNDAPLSVQYGVLKDKKMLYCSDKEKVVDLHYYVLTRYLDIKPLRDQLNRDFLETIVNGDE